MTDQRFYISTERGPSRAFFIQAHGSDHTSRRFAT